LADRGFLAPALAGVILASMSGWGEMCAFVMPQVADPTIYKITFQPEPSIAPWCEAPPYSAWVSALTVSPDKNSVDIFYTEPLRVWNRKTDEIEDRRFEEVGHFGMKTLLSRSGKYLLVECFGKDMRGRRFALIEACSGRLIRYVKCDDAILTSACFSPEERYIFSSCQFSVIRCGLEGASDDKTVWLENSPRKGVFNDVRCSDQYVYVTTIFRNERDEPCSLVEAVSVEGERKIVIDAARGWPFDALPPSDIHAFYAVETGEITIQYSDAKEIVSFQADRATILQALKADPETYDLAEDIFAAQTANPRFAYFDYKAITPDERYAVFGLNTRSARMKGLFILYDLKRRVWDKGLVVGNQSEGGSTWPFFVSQK